MIDTIRETSFKDENDLVRRFNICILENSKEDKLLILNFDGYLNGGLDINDIQENSDLRDLIFSHIQEHFGIKSINETEIILISGSISVIYNLYDNSVLRIKNSDIKNNYSEFF